MRRWLCVLMLLPGLVWSCAKEKQVKPTPTARLPSDDELYKPIAGAATRYKAPVSRRARRLPTRIVRRNGRIYHQVFLHGRWFVVRPKHPGGTRHRSTKARFYFQNLSPLIRPWERRVIQRVRQRGCAVAALRGRERRSAKRALHHAIKALQSAELQALLRYRSFTYTSLLGPQIIKKVKRLPVRLKVLGYRGRRFSCKVGHNAYAFITYSLVFINRAYLGTKRGSRGWKGLAGTIAHEWMHALGFMHGGSGVNVTSRREQNSVPHYIGCLVRHYPDLTRGKVRCGRRISFE